MSNTGTPRGRKPLSDADPPAPRRVATVIDHRPQTTSSPVHRAIFPGPLEKSQQGSRVPVRLFSRLLSPPYSVAHTNSLSSLPVPVPRPVLAPSMAMAAAEWWEAAAAAIVAYTGLTPAAFFTAVAAAAALYVAVSGLFARPEPVPARRREAEDEGEGRAFGPLPPPVQLGEVTEEELRAYDGSDPKKPLLMAIKGQIYDVTQSRYTRSSLLPTLQGFSFVSVAKIWTGDTSTSVNFRFRRSKKSLVLFFLF